MAVKNPRRHLRQNRPKSYFAINGKIDTTLVESAQSINQSNKFILCKHEKCQQVKQTKKNNIIKAYFNIIIKKFRLLTRSINRPT